MPLTELFHYFRPCRGREKLNVLFGGPLWPYEKFKKGRNLNLMDKGRPADKTAFILFGLALSLTLLVLFVPAMTLMMKIALVLLAVLLLGLMGRRLDAPLKINRSDLILPVVTE